MSEGVPSCDVINKESTCCAAIVRTCDALEGLLTGRVPDLQLDVLLVNLNCARTELNSDCQVVLLSESFVRKL